MPRCPIVELYPVFRSCNNAVILAMLRPFLPIIYIKNVFTFSCELNDFRHFSFFSIMCGSNRGCTIPPPGKGWDITNISTQKLWCPVGRASFSSDRPVVGQEMSANAPVWGQIIERYSPSSPGGMVHPRFEPHIMEKKWKMSEIVQFAKIRENIFM